MRQLVVAVALLFVCALPARAQNNKPPSSWGVVVGIAPQFAPWQSAEVLTKLVFDEHSTQMLRGSEFRIGIARGRWLSGDWGVSFFRKTFDEQDPDTVQEGRGCNGSSQPGAPFISQCTLYMATRTADALRMNGVEVHKYFAFVTIRQRVQVGLNLAGGIGIGSGGFTNQTFERHFTCTYPIGVFPDFSNEDDPCAGAASRSAETIVPTGNSTEPFTSLLNYDKNRVPIGKVELAGTVIVTPQLKVRIGGGLNYPGRTTFGLTGIYFFGKG